MAVDDRGCTLPEQHCDDISHCTTVCACDVQYNDYSGCTTYVEQNTFTGHINATFNEGNIIYADDINTLYGDVNQIATHFKTSLQISDRVSDKKLIKYDHPNLARNKTALVGSYTNDPNLTSESDYVSKLNTVTFAAANLIDATDLSNLVDVIKAISNNCRCICDNVTKCSVVCHCDCHYS